MTDHPVTGRMPEMLQDCHRPLSKWLANRIDSKMHAREAAESFFDIDAEVADVQRAIARRPKINPLPEPDYRPEICTSEWVQEQVKSGSIALLLVTATFFVISALWLVWFFMGRQGG